MKLWSERRRAELEKLPLALWASRRRQKLLELLDVGIELGRASFRRRVTTLALSVARWVYNSAMTTFSEVPLYNNADGRVSQVRFEAFAFRQ
jgi:hypothetical protein